MNILAILIILSVSVNAIYIYQPEIISGEITTYNYRYWGAQKFNISRVTVVLASTSLCDPTTVNFEGSIVISQFGPCSVETKARNAQLANASAIIEQYNQPGDGSYASGVFDGTGNDIIIPALIASVNVPAVRNLLHVLQNNENVIADATPTPNPYMYGFGFYFRLICEAILGVFVVFLLISTIIGIYKLYKKEGWRLSVKQSILVLNLLSIIFWFFQILDPLQQNGIYNNAASYIFYTATIPFQLMSLLLLTFYWLEILYTMKYTTTLIKYKWIFFSISALIFIISWVSAIGLGYYISLASNLLLLVTFVLTSLQFVTGTAFLYTGLRVTKTINNTNLSSKVNNFVIWCGVAQMCVVAASVVYTISLYLATPYLLIVQYQFELCSTFMVSLFQIRAVRVKEKYEETAPQEKTKAVSEIAKDLEDQVGEKVIETKV